MSETKPTDAKATNTAPIVTIAPTYKDEETGALYVHQDLVKVQEPWEEEAHISPMDVTERFGDVESWVEYVERFGGGPDYPPFLIWNRRGLQAVLDYPADQGSSGRCQWRAECPFVTTRQWNAWTGLALQAVGQRAAVERIEDLAEDILQPAPADLAGILRTLRATVSSKATTELRPDGTNSVAWTKDQTVKSGAEGSVELPPAFTIAIPVLKGHVDQEGRPVVYNVEVRLRVSMDDNAHLVFRFGIPTAERILEDAYLDRVKAAKVLLGKEMPLLRAAD